MHFPCPSVPSIQIGVSATRKQKAASSPWLVFAVETPTKHWYESFYDLLQDRQLLAIISPRISAYFNKLDEILARPDRNLSAPFTQIHHKIMKYIFLDALHHPQFMHNTAQRKLDKKWMNDNSNVMQVNVAEHQECHMAAFEHCGDSRDLQAWCSLSIVKWDLLNAMENANAYSTMPLNMYQDWLETRNTELVNSMEVEENCTKQFIKEKTIAYADPALYYDFPLAKPKLLKDLSL